MARADKREGGARIQIKQVRSGIGCAEPHKKILRSLGLGKMNRVRSLPDTPSVRGMAAKIPHLVEIVSI